ncbi:zinc finger CCCH domain-containing protein 2-like [Eucalyptus grandis]|uniref:zinc finger CCCH domain-containing protein 2-like n=1 Tax=Eucalyptus grandis TaxID=71139 RepID=UPI00192ECC53|nr:zinc finger CCCH domain-containing protein 2-like [Eucalyptus grandis]
MSTLIPGLACFFIQVRFSRFCAGTCKKGDSCEFAHGVFECWLHPERYRTQACKDGQSCRRGVCFFAYSPDQLRVLPGQQQQQQQQHSPKSATDSEFGSMVRPSAAATAAFDSYFTKPWSASFISSPTSILTTSSPPISPPMSPNQRGGCCGSPGSVSELVACMRNMQIAKMKMSPCGQMAGSLFDLWESHHRCEEEPLMERVESGRDLRAKMYAKLSKGNSLDGSDLVGSGSGPDVGWVSELVM